MISLLVEVNKDYFMKEHIQVRQREYEAFLVERDLHYASFLRRLVATAIDFFVWVLLNNIWGFVYGFGSGFFGVESRMFGVGALVFIGLGLVNGLGYLSLTQCSAWQATVGQKLMKIKVTDLNGKRLNFAQSLIRAFAFLLTVATLGVGMLVSLFTDRKQALHDIITKTLVVRQ